MFTISTTVVFRYGGMLHPCIRDGFQIRVLMNIGKSKHVTRMKSKSELNLGPEIRFDMLYFCRNDDNAKND